MGLMFLDVSEVRSKVLSVLHKAEFEEPSSWDQILQAANEAAYDDIVSYLLARGYTLAQVSLWDARETYARDQSTFWALVNGGQLEAYDPEFVDKLDRRKDLLTVILTIDGIVITPERISSGRLKNPTDRYTERSPEGGRGRRRDVLRGAWDWGNDWEGCDW